MEVTDVTDHPDRQFIQSYGPGRFKISGRIHYGPVLVSPEQVFAWPVAGMAELTVASLERLLEPDARPEILILGCGETLLLPPKAIRAELRAMGVSLEPMDTGAACRTYNVLMGEARPVAAALIALPEET